MEARTVAIFGIVAVVLAGALVALGSIPTSAYTGGKQTIICTADLTITGTYTDLLVSHTISNLALTGGGTGCHAQTLLDLVPSSSFNILPFGLSFSVTLTGPDGTTHGPYRVGTTIGAGEAAPSVSFTASTQIASVPQDKYSAMVTCPVTCSNGGNTYTTTINI